MGPIIVKLQSLVSDLDRELMRNHRFDTALFDELTELQLKSGITHGRRPISPFLRPYFLPASVYGRVREGARQISEAFETLTRSALEYPNLMDALGLTEKERRFARLEPGYRAVSVTSRLDAFLGPEGFKFLEYNAETPAGVGDQHVLAEIYNSIPEVRAFLARHPHVIPQPHDMLIGSLIEAYRQSGGRTPSPSIAIVDWKGVDTSAEFEILREFFESRGFASTICDPSELEYIGGNLTAGNFAIDIIYKRVIVHEFLEKFDEEHPMARAVADGAVCIANSFRSKIPHKKAGFAVLSDERYSGLFNNEQLAAIQAHIPWTRRVEDRKAAYQGELIDLLPFLRRARERMLLKPNDDYGGKGIVFGWECSEGRWDDAIESALAADYVVQERVEVIPTAIPVFRGGEASIETLNVDFDPYLFMGTVEGGMVRLAAGSLVNITQGGGETALVILSGC